MEEFSGTRAPSGHQFTAPGFNAFDLPTVPLGSDAGGVAPFMFAQPTFSVTPEQFPAPFLTATSLLVPNPSVAYMAAQRSQAAVPAPTHATATRQPTTQAPTAATAATSSAVTSSSSSGTAVVGGPAVLAPRQKMHLRKAAGGVWSDPTLDDWPEDDFRVFCGDLGNEVTDELLSNAFRHLRSFQRARVIRDKRTGKGKGYGFVSFSNPEDMLRAIKEMDRKYVGNRPIRVMKSKWQEREVDSSRNKRAPEVAVPLNSKELKKFKGMKPVTGGKKSALAPAAPPPTQQQPGAAGFRGRGYRGMRPPGFGGLGGGVVRG